MFFEKKEFNFAAYADDNTSYFCDKNLKVLLSKLQICALKLYFAKHILLKLIFQGEGHLYFNCFFHFLAF